tara:strand:+ start:1561 stop:5583 length:4023 start_codon:yes stop_codon:yes gene_type:complete
MSDMHIGKQPIRANSKFYDRSGNVGAASSILVAAQNGEVEWIHPYDAGLQGLQGTQGVQGILGTEGKHPGVELEFDSSTSTSNMSNGLMRFNTSNQYQASQIIISNQDYHGNGISAWVNTFDDTTNPGDKGTLWIYGSDDDQTWDTNEFIIATVTDITSYFGYKVIDITIRQTNYGFSDGDRVFLQFYAIGDQGTQGIQGVQGTQGVQGVQGVQGTQGIQGVQGTQGIQGITGTEGQHAGIPYEFSTSTSNADPGNGKFRYNSQYTWQTTRIYIDDRAAGGGADLQPWLRTFDDSTDPNSKGHLVIYGSDDDQTWDSYELHIWNITSVTEHTGYFELAVTSVDTNYSFSNGDICFLQFYRTGDRGLQGDAASVQGIQGIKGNQGVFGIQGDASTVQGLQGTQGRTGNQGRTGIQGDASSVQGLQGTQGIKGNQGNLGIQGDAASVQGLQGIQGTKGNQGILGVQGDAAEVQGLQGIQGQLGNQGILGIQGDAASVQGIQGTQGVIGFSGTNNIIWERSANNITTNSSSWKRFKSDGTNNASYYDFSGNAWWYFGGTTNVTDYLDDLRSQINGGSKMYMTVNKFDWSQYMVYEVTAITLSAGTASSGSSVWRFSVSHISTHNITGTGSFSFTNYDEYHFNFQVTGAQGAQGVDGQYAGIGLQGLQGIQGRTGNQGRTGVQGDAATVQGLQGIQGRLGNQGILGIQGDASSVQGLQGVQGRTGNQGNLGVQGDAASVQGLTGVQGRRGFQGHLGVQGDAASVQGLQGTQGGGGNQGTTGTGLQGDAASVQGLQGIQGRKGNQGNYGVQGDAATVQGLQGVQGRTGSQGILGVQGDAASVQGLQGGQGVTGDQFTAQTYTISVPGGSGGGYYINGVSRDDLFLIRGQRYVFDQSSSTNNNHPIRLSTTSNGTHAGGTQYTSGWTYTGTAGSNGEAVFVVPFDAPNTLYYYCANHSGMAGSASISIRNLNAEDLQGIKGNQGDDGVQGDAASVQGLQGNIGAGSQGAAGPQGNAANVQGIQGPQGVQGNNGLQGIYGVQGRTGAGNQGADGSQGITGAGLQGDAASVQGLQGTQGDFGVQGQVGLPVKSGVYNIVVHSSQSSYGTPSSLPSGSFAFNGFRASSTSQVFVSVFDAQGRNFVPWSTSNFPADLELQFKSGSYWTYFRFKATSRGSITHGSGGNPSFYAVNVSSATYSNTNTQMHQWYYAVNGNGSIGGSDPGTGTANGWLMTFGPAPGLQGVQGGEGPQGGTGLQGLDGFGLQGSLGIQGIQGTDGTGLQGIQGADASAIAAQGAPGPQGLTGAGSQGAIGTQGDAASVQGIQGPSGSVGGDTVSTPLAIALAAAL